MIFKVLEAHKDFAVLNAGKSTPKAIVHVLPPLGGKTYSFNWTRQNFEMKDILRLIACSPNNN